MSPYSTHLTDSEVFFGKNANNQPVIKFFDPSYVRAETIVFEPRTRQVHAVLHENLHYLGRIPEELGASFQQGGPVVLSSDHNVVKLTAQISVSRN